MRTAQHYWRCGRSASVDPVRTGCLLNLQTLLQVGYCQGMNFVAGLLLMYLPEQHAFGGLVVLMQDRGLRKYYSTDMSLIQVRGLLVCDCILVSTRHAGLQLCLLAPCAQRAGGLGLPSQWQFDYVSAQHVQHQGRLQHVMLSAHLCKSGRSARSMPIGASLVIQHTQCAYPCCTFLLSCRLICGS
jgi:hypothetical protein